MLEAALKYALKGWAVFPIHTTIGLFCSCGTVGCGKSGKHPRIDKWNEKATVDPETIRAWWTKWKDANIGIITGRKSGVVVLDVDPRNGGNETLEQLMADIGVLPPSLRVRTGGDGQHLIFRNPKHPIEQGSSKLGSGIDVKGDGGYIIAPPSLHRSGNRYEWIDNPDDTPLAELPDAVVERIGRVITPQNVTTSSTEALIPKGERDNRLFQFALKFYHQGYSEDVVLAMLSGINERLCEQPEADRITEDDLRRIVTSAKSYASPQEDFQLCSLSDLRELPAPEWQIPGLFQENSVIMIYGPSGVGKTFATIDMACSLAYDGKWYTGNGKPGSVVYVAGESGRGIVKRVDAWRSAKGITQDLDRLIVNNGPVDLGNPQTIERFIKVIEKFSPSLVVFDTLARCTPGKDENSSGVMGSIVQQLDNIKKELKTSVVIVHHTGKSGDQERGSSALRAAMDTMIAVRQEGNDDCITILCDKQKEAEPIPPLYFKLTSHNSSLILSPAKKEDVKTKSVEDRVLDYIKASPWCRNKGIATDLGIDKSQVSDATAALLEKGMIIERKVEGDKRTKEFNVDPKQEIVDRHNP
jgi:hypothetical protein